MNKDGSLTISNFDAGVAPSAYTGFQQMVNVDIFSSPDSVRISNKLMTDGDSANMVDALPKWGVQNPDDGHTFIVDENGKLYERNNSGNYTLITGHGTTNANGEGIGIWNDYLFYARRTKLDVYALPSSPNGDAGTWYNNWQTLESSFSYNLHPIQRLQDSSLYIGNGHYIDRLDVVLGQTFDPGNTATFAYSSQALALDRQYKVVLLEEYGTLLAIGTFVGISVSQALNIGDMFFWDGYSEFVSAGTTIHFAEDGVKMTKNSSGILHTIAGTGVPRLFKSSTSVAVEAKRFTNIQLEIGQKMSLFPGAIDHIDGEVIMGIGKSSSASDETVPMGVYSYRAGAYVTRNTISTGEEGANGPLKIGLVRAITGNRFIVGWEDGSQSPNAFGIDLLSNFFYTDYTAYIDSPLYVVGTTASPKTFERVEVRMGKKMQTGDGVRIKARHSLDDPWVIVATFDGTNYVGRRTFETKFGALSDFVECQIRIELTTRDTNQDLSPELREVILR